MTEEKLGIRLSRIKISNYKKIDSLEFDLLPPLIEGDADILLLGSKNGGGKSSILECCSLLMLAGLFTKQFKDIFKRNETLDITDLLVKAGQKKTNIEGEFKQNEKKCIISLEINRREGFLAPTIKGDKSLFQTNKKNKFDAFDYHLNSVFSFSGEPLIIPPLLHFNSYRKVQEFNPDLAAMADDYPPKNYDARRQSGTRNIVNRDQVSSFKLEILRSLIGQASLFGDIDKEQSQTVLTQLNYLIQRYCGCQIENLRPFPDNKVDIRIKPIYGKESFSFNGLSSGQKEMISTLFLIWKNTNEHPSVVLIDEPELHLNAEWHGDFVRQLYKLVPHNQYILATHSEEMFRSVDERHRAILIPDEDQ
jgi:predicted ATPase